MEVSLLKNTKTELEIEIKGASETLLIPLLNKTLADSKVDYASQLLLCRRLDR